MPALTAAALLDVWEQGCARHPLDRALLLAGVACPDQPYDALVDWPVGRRDAAILQLRQAAFGPTCQVYLDCPACGERLEFAFDSRALQPPEPGEIPAAIVVQDWRFRPPTSRDLACITDATDLEQAARQLLRQCWLAETDRDAPAWSTALLEEVENRLSEADPQADLELAIACEICGHAWKTVFDIVGFCWEEIAARAEQALLKANPHLATLTQVKPGAVLVLPEVDGAPPRFQRAAGNPPANVLSTVADALQQYRARLAGAARTELAQIDSETRALDNAEIQRALDGSAELRALGAALKSGLNQRAEDAKAAQEFADQTLDQAARELANLIATVG